METMFLSCQKIDADLPQTLIATLRKQGFVVDHSPRNPHDGPDSRWEGWYEKGLAQAIEESRAFVIVVDHGWDSSTWMAMEAGEGLKKAQSLGGEYLMAYWNPGDIVVEAKGMVGYLKERLPNDVEMAVDALTRRSSGRA